MLERCTSPAYDEGREGPDGSADEDIRFRRWIFLFHDAAAWLGQIVLFVMLGLLSFPSRLWAVAGEAQCARLGPFVIQPDPGPDYVALRYDPHAVRDVDPETPARDADGTPPPGPPSGAASNEAATRETDPRAT